MIGSIIMDISEEQMCAAIQYWLNNVALQAYAEADKVVVRQVRQRSNGRFSIDFDGRGPKRLPEMKEVTT